MDDHIASTAFEPHWIPAGDGADRGGARPAGRVPTGRAPTGRAPTGRARAPQFLQRDLSDEALRQPVEPVFSQAELAAARQQGFDAGHAAGIAAATASRAAACKAAEIKAIGVIASAMADARQESARVADLAAEALARTVVAAMDAVMPDLIRRSALNEVSAMLALVLPGLSREPAVRVEVAQEIAGSISATLGSLPTELSDKITVIGMNELRPGDTRVHWNAGYAGRQPAQVWQAVMDALQPALHEPEFVHPELTRPELGHTEAKDSSNGD
ncbi:MAG TPA: hypothetical protein VHU42_11225 [Rhodopila sp.]|jgi:hypothetical protein|nr:hypothetical protein [Rhodopila sp.]